VNYVEEIHQLVGRATVCWHDDGTFNVGEATKIASRLCDIVREQQHVHGRIGARVVSDGVAKSSRRRRRRAA
jgi:hypothetical protein